MTATLRQALIAFAIVVSPLALAAPDAASQAANRDAQTQADFQARVKTFVAMRQKLAASAPALPDKATPEQIEAHQLALGKAVMAARKGARQGAIFGSEMTVLIRRLLGPIFKGPDGPAIRSAILEEPHPLVPAVNIRYPDEVPVSTMPPDILKALPKIDESIEFRFVGRHLILLDVPSHLILDVVDNAMPS